MSPVYALIIAGGRGTRFWPRSRRHLPKQCLSVSEGPSLLQRTVERLHPLVPAEWILIITAADMADAVREQLPQLPPENILVEPEGRNTAPCVGWGAIEVMRRAGPDAIMAVLPADHLIEKEQDFRDALVSCAEAASETQALVTLGIQPTHPETGFGYLELGPEAGRWRDRTLQWVSRFVEKPDLERAEAFYRGGQHLWNAGMFVFTVRAVTSAFEEHLPESWMLLQELLELPERLDEIYPKLEKISIDFGIMERARSVMTLPADLGWSDLGSWTAVEEHLPPSEIGRALVKEGLSLDSRNNIVHAPGTLVAMVGVEDLVVVQTEDALLICHRDRAQDVGKVVAELGQRGLPHYT